MTVVSGADFAHGSDAEPSPDAERLAFALEAGRIGTWEWDLRSQTAVWHEILYDLLGRERGAPVVPETFFEYIHPDDLEAVRARVRSAWAGRETFSDTFRIVRDDGAIRWLASRSRIYRDADGEPVRMAGVNFDVTDYKTAEAERERLLIERTAVMERMVDALIIADPDGRIVYHNPASLALHGYGSMREARISGEEAAARWTIRDLDGTPVPVQEWPLPRALRDESFTDVELRVRRRETGREFVGSYSGGLVRGDAGEPLFAMLTIRDITEQKHADAVHAHRRELLQGVFDTIPVLLVVWEPALRRFTLNRHAEEVLGWTTEEANEDDFLRRVYPDPMVRAYVAGFMRSLEPGWREFPCRRKTGEVIPVDWANVGLTDQTRIGIGVDLRERREAEDALRRAHDELETRVRERTAQLRLLITRIAEAEERERDRIARGLHDEVGQLLAACQFKLSGLKGAGPAELPERVESLDTLLGRASDEIRGLVFESSSRTLHHVGFTAAARELCETVSSRFGLDVTWWDHTRGARLSPSAEACLYHCLRELLYNAARHAEADSVQVYFRLSEGSAVLRVHDDGKGFEGETAGRTLTREGGFGLFSIRERIEDLGGSLSIRSHPGDGATVTVSVPLGGDGSEETGEER